MKKILTFALAVSMMASLAASASALEYSIAPPKDFDFGGDTSIEVIHTADGGAMKNARRRIMKGGLKLSRLCIEKVLTWMRLNIG